MYSHFIYSVQITLYHKRTTQQTTTNNYETKIMNKKPFNKKGKRNIFKQLAIIKK